MKLEYLGRCLSATDLDVQYPSSHRDGLLHFGSHNHLPIRFSGFATHRCHHYLISNSDLLLFNSENQSHGHKRHRRIKSLPSHTSPQKDLASL